MITSYSEQKERRLAAFQLIRNVPYIIHNNDYCYYVDVAVKLAIISDLMREDSIKNDVNFKDVEDVDI